MPRKCLKHPDGFCLKVYEQIITKEYHSGYQEDVYDIFGCPLDDQDKTWAPHKIYKKCFAQLAK